MGGTVNGDDFRQLRWTTEFKLIASERDHPRAAAEKFRKVADQIERIPAATWAFALRELARTREPAGGPVGEPYTESPDPVQSLTSGWGGIWRVEISG